ncbi:MAG TPA: hypothetical protein DCG79_04610 [Clostridiales bacterium]|nr:hypothetical protein [Clostridiales bacterium]
MTIKQHIGTQNGITRLLPLVQTTCDIVCVLCRFVSLQTREIKRYFVGDIRPTKIDSIRPVQADVHVVF